MKKTKNSTKTKPNGVIAKNIPGHKPTTAYLVALKAVAAMGKKKKV